MENIVQIVIKFVSIHRLKKRFTLQMNVQIKHYEVLFTNGKRKEFKVLTNVKSAASSNKMRCPFWIICVLSLSLLKNSNYLDMPHL